MPVACVTPPELAPVAAQTNVWLNPSRNVAVTLMPAIVAPVVEKANTEADVVMKPLAFVQVPWEAVMRVGQVTPVGATSV